MFDQQHNLAKKPSPRIARNERLTALAGTILLILILIELFITASLHALIIPHIFVGVLLSGPLVVKMLSTGYRFLRYYMKDKDFVLNGPPQILLRLLAPLLVLITLLVFISGFGLAIVGPDHMGILFKIHAASVAVWLPLLAVHIYGYIRKVPRLVAGDWRKNPPNQVSGRKWRLGINIFAVLIGAIAAIVMVPISSQWSTSAIHGGLPSPLVLGIVAAVVAIFVAKPLFRITNHIFMRER